MENYKQFEVNNKTGNQETILTKDSPALLLFTVPFLIGGLFFMVLPWGLASNSSQIPLIWKFATSGLGLICALVPAAVIKGGLKETVIDRATNTVIVRKQFTGTELNRFAASEVSDLTIRTTRDSDGDAMYQLQFKFKNGHMLPLTNHLTSSKTTAEHERERVLFLLRNPYQTYTGKDTTPLISFGADSSSSLSNWIAVFIGIAIIVTVGPFAAWRLAEQEKPSPAERIESGTPSPQLSRQLIARAADKIDNNEQILFVATPEPGHEGRVKIWFMPFAVIWTMFAICWTGLALVAAVSSKSFGAWFMVLFGMPFVAIGVGMLATPYISYKRELHTIYAITDRRALTFSKDGVRELVAFDDQHFGPIEPKGYSPTRMDVMFRSSLDAESPGVTGGFWGIEKGNEAVAILQAKWQEKLQENLKNPTKARGSHRHRHK